MAVLAVISKIEQVNDAVTWAARFADSRGTDLQVLCWCYSPAVQYPLLADNVAAQEVEKLTSSVRDLIQFAEELDKREFPLKSEKIQIQSSLQPDLVTATVEYIRQNEIELLVAMSNDDSNLRTRRLDRKNPLLRQSPCDTVMLLRGRKPTAALEKIFVATSDTPSDPTTAALAARLSASQHVQVNMVRMEDDPGQDAKEVGRQELRNLMKVAGIKRTDLIRHNVFLLNQEIEIMKLADRSDLVLLSANGGWPIQELISGTTRPAIAVVKRAPPLRRIGSQWIMGLLSPLSPASYGDLIQGLRHDSKITEDFTMMLGLAAAIASLGLLQDSPAVVIGSMLLAPLMTPMIGCGLATAQANPTLGRTAQKTIFFGFLLTLVISMFIGWVTPGTELTTQIMARGNPNILDLMVALFSGSAAAYALARPNIAGAVAGVAIATALVPPLCSSGISLAYFQFDNALGAGILFIVNVVAIILSAAVTFRFLGVTSLKATAWQRQWVTRVVAALGIIVIALAIPLNQSLENRLLSGRPSPNSYPLTKAVHDAVVDEIEKEHGFQLITGGRPSSKFDRADVVLVLSAPEQIDSTLEDRLKEIVRREMKDDQLKVEIHCLKNYWHSSEESNDQDGNSK